MKQNIDARRKFIKYSITSLIGMSAGTSLYAKRLSDVLPDQATLVESLSAKYPSTDDEQVARIVGASHGDFDTVKKMVSASPELARATWDWGYGDWESALGAASHVGRKDIADFLIDHGARPNIFTFVMMGALQAVRAMVEAVPGIQRIPGPHGITLLQHAKNRLRAKNLSPSEITALQEVEAYLKSLGDADIGTTSLPVDENEKTIYVGRYKLETEETFFEISLNSGGLLQIKRDALFGRILHKTDEHVFSPAGAPSVKISFAIENEKAVSLTIHQPTPVFTATRI